MLKDVDLQAWSATLYRFCFSCRSSLGGFELRPRVAGTPSVTRATRVELQIIQVHFSKLDSPVLFFLWTWLRRQTLQARDKGSCCWHPPPVPRCSRGKRLVKQSTHTRAHTHDLFSLSKNTNENKTSFTPMNIQLRLSNESKTARARTFECTQPSWINQLCIP